MVKLVSDMSKKMLVAHSTCTRAWVVERLGTVMPWVPSFGVFAASIVPNVLPPSSESRMLTLAQLTGAAVVFATFQVTVCPLPDAQFTAVLGAVTRNGPALVTTGILTVP